MSRNPREYTCNLIEMMETGMISSEQVAKMALNFLSESDVVAMINNEDLTDVVEQHRKAFGYNKR